MYELKSEEFKNLRSQIATSSWGGTRYAPIAFTEKGIAMISGILKSKNDETINKIFEAIRQQMQPPNPPRKKIGFKKE